jgi:methylmalonyl-CoA/ethylmalonyl-CoA epimerase
MHHVGVACANIEEELRRIAALHTIAGQSPLVFDPGQNAQLMLLTLADGTRIELVAGPAVETLVRKKITYYHLCFEVQDIHAELDRLLGAGAILLSPPKPALLFEDREVAFLQVSYGIIELLSQK